MTKTERMLEMVLRNQSLILVALYEHATPAEFRQKLWAAAEETEASISWSATDRRASRSSR